MTNQGDTMDIQRIQDLETTDTKLTEEEVKKGYHFCPDWDGMIVGPNDPEWAMCLCGHCMSIKEQRIAKAEMDRNCNTCADLERVKHKKDKLGFLYGICKHHQYTNTIKFHPDDYMGMRCYINRDTLKPSEF